MLGEVLNTSSGVRREKALIPLEIPLHATCIKKIPFQICLLLMNRKPILLMLARLHPLLRGSYFAACQRLLQKHIPLFRYVNVPTETRPSLGTAGSGTVNSSLIFFSYLFT